jgi:hypothetical protein
MRVPPVVLSVAGYDPSSGAGITADIKTAASLGCYAVTCITALTVQSTQGVFGVQPLAPEAGRPNTGGAGRRCGDCRGPAGHAGIGSGCGSGCGLSPSRRLPNVVLDPVIRSSSGTALLDEAGVQVLRTLLIPLCDVITPNVDEAAALIKADPPPPGAASWDVVLPRAQRDGRRPAQTWRQGRGHHRRTFAIGQRLPELQSGVWGKSRRDRFGRANRVAVNPWNGLRLCDRPRLSISAGRHAAGRRPCR